ncbi:MAG TPA: hypothetical protein VME19_00760 [Streptosporangiaceae bacterium]|nr:hypothetical protein [Streptosporangiaceae bacterium]
MVRVLPLDVVAADDVVLLPELHAPSPAIIVAAATSVSHLDLRVLDMAILLAPQGRSSKYLGKVSNVSAILRSRMQRVNPLLPVRYTRPGIDSGQ